jgi:hypothetical protein
MQWPKDKGRKNQQESTKQYTEQRNSNRKERINTGAPVG